MHRFCGVFLSIERQIRLTKITQVLQIPMFKKAVKNGIRIKRGAR